MFRPLPLYVGLRYLRAKRRNHFISFISLTSILGLTLGVAVLILVLSVMNGFDRELQNRILGMVSQANVWKPGGLQDWPAAVRRAEDSPGVEAAAPFLQLQGMLAEHGMVTGVFVNGVVPDHEMEVSILHRHMLGGQLETLQPGTFNIVIGAGIARKLGLALGDRVTLVMPEATVSPAGVLPRFKRFTVSGIFKVGAELDDMMGYIPLRDAQILARMDDKVQGLRLRVDSLFSAQRIADGVADELGSSHYATDWTRTHGNLFQAIKLEKTMMALLLMLIVAVAAFNIVSSLVMVVTDKKADIAILRTLGASPGTIMGIFMVQGTFIGFLGVSAGTLLGIFAALNVTDFASWLEQVLHRQLFKQYFVNYLPSELRLEHVVIVVSVAFLMSFLATLYPAYKASRVQPAEALRHE